MPRMEDARVYFENNDSFPLWSLRGTFCPYTFMPFTALEKQNSGLAKSLGKPCPPRIKFHKTKPVNGMSHLGGKAILCFWSCFIALPPAPSHSKTVHQMCEHLSHVAPPALEASWWLIFSKDWIPPRDSAMIWHLHSPGCCCLPGCWLVNVQLLFSTWWLPLSKHFVWFLLLLLLLPFTEDKTGSL